MAADTVLGVFTRERLPNALASLHRDGYGPNIRVLDAERGALAGQLTRAGVIEAPTFDGSVQMLVMVFAPARVARVVDVLQRTGAHGIHVVERPATNPTNPFMGADTRRPSRMKPVKNEPESTPADNEQSPPITDPPTLAR